MAVLFFFTNGNSDSKDEEVIVKTEEIPTEEELSIFEIEKKPFNLKELPNSDTINYIQVSVTISYYKAVEGILSTETKVDANKAAILEIIRKYFLDLTVDDIKEHEAIDKVKEELKIRINEFLMKNEKVKGEIVYTVNFGEWLYQ
jgi:flagellar basal body-associated protein FliL